MALSGLRDVEASCAICGASSTYGECEHEGQRLELALDQAMARWTTSLHEIRDWVLNHARDQVINTFTHLKAARYEAHLAYLQTLPCYTLYQKFRGNPPLQPPQLAVLHQQIQHAQAIFQAGVDEDWRRSCMKYPEVLDYYFNLVDFDFPDDRDTVVRDPEFGPRDARRVKVRRDSRQRKRDRRRGSRGRTPIRR